MWTWLRNTLGRCQNRWRHDWITTTKGDKDGLGDKRRCSVCNKQQKCVGVYQFDIDANLMQQWEDIP